MLQDSDEDAAALFRAIDLEDTTPPSSVSAAPVPAVVSPLPTQNALYIQPQLGRSLSSDSIDIMNNLSLPFSSNSALGSTYFYGAPGVMDNTVHRPISQEERGLQEEIKQPQGNADLSFVLDHFDNEQQFGIEQLMAEQYPEDFTQEQYLEGYQDPNIIRNDQHENQLDGQQSGYGDYADDSYYNSGDLYPSTAAPDPLADPAFSAMYDSKQPVLSYSSVVKLANNDTFALQSEMLQESLDNSAPEVHQKMCIYFMHGTCRFGRNCRYRHELGNTCPYCDKPLASNNEDRLKHLSECDEARAIEKEREESASINCGICLENVSQSGRRFGLLPSCNHAFCLRCIREWRGSLVQRKENVRCCPVCRAESYFVVPCDRFVLNPDRKKILVQKYKDHIGKIPCIHFNRAKGVCPFGSSCFYAHLNEDGSMAQEERPRHYTNADGQVQVIRSVLLSDFL